MSDLMADLRAAAEGTSPEVGIQLSPLECARLLALLDAGKACRDWVGCDAVHEKSPRGGCECSACEAARQYDEAAK